jgi:hypothetical protein
MELDEEIDSYFLKQPQICYGEPLPMLLTKLREIRRDAFAQEKRLEKIKV